jgi:TRAP-type C4-dicarboxylate transport system substrate-binding protein
MKESGGTVDIEIYPGGTLGRNPRVQLKLVLDGVADLAFIVPDYTPGRFPDDEVFNMPFTAANGLEAAIASHRMFKKGLLSGFDDVVVLGHFSSMVLHLQTNFPVKKPGDLRGRKFRAANKFHADMLKSLGAIGIGMPSPQVAENMSRGIIDGAINDNGALFAFRIVDVANYHNVIPLGCVSLAVVMNKKVYESLPAKARAAFDNRGEDIVTMWYEKGQAENRKRFEGLKKDPKHTVTIPSPEDVKEWKAAIQPTVDAWLADNPKRQKLFKSYQEELKAIRSGR